MADALDLDSLFGPERPPVNAPVNAPAAAPVVSVATPPRNSGPSLLTILALAIAVFFAVMWLRSNWQSNDGDDRRVDVNVPGNVVMVVWDERDTSITEDQAIVINTTKIQTYCEENDIEYRRHDVDDDLSRAEPYYAALMKAAADPPSIIIATPTHASTSRFPTDVTVEDVIETIEKESK